MAMSVPGEGGDDRAMSEINTTPLVDVMLVLLIIFLITIPVITQTIKVDLPKVANQPTKTKPENITVAIDAKGGVFGNQSQVPDDQALLDLVKSVAVQDPQPEIHIRGDSQAKFGAVGRTIYLIQRGGGRLPRSWAMYQKKAWSEDQAFKSTTKRGDRRGLELHRGKWCQRRQPLQVSRCLHLETIHIIAGSILPACDVENLTRNR